MNWDVNVIPRHECIMSWLCLVVQLLASAAGVLSCQCSAIENVGLLTGRELLWTAALISLQSIAPLP